MLARTASRLPASRFGPGTYYLVFQNGAVTNGDSVFWDENDGSSSASQSGTGIIGSEAFQILGNSWRQCHPVALDLDDADRRICWSRLFRLSRVEEIRRGILSSLIDTAEQISERPP